MNYGIISTWRMSFEGLEKAFKMLQEKSDAGDAVEVLIKDVEDNPYYKSVGYGGLPNRECVVETDSAYMDGNTLKVGAIAGASGIKNPISVSKDLTRLDVNNLLVGAGAEKYARDNGFEMCDMLTDRAKKMWEIKREEILKQNKLDAYDGHDTVGAISLDMSGKLVSATSTSGLFMKRPGRVGDSPLCGCGFYADSNIGGATATGLGEDIMKGVLSYEVVRKISEGQHPQEACDNSVYEFARSLKKRGNIKEDIQISLIAMDTKGNWGAATTVEFTFCVANQNEEPKIYISWPGDNNTTKIEEVSQEWLEAYDKRIHADI